MEVILKQTASGLWLGWPKEREDIMASGLTKMKCRGNLKKMHKAVKEYEAGLAGTCHTTSRQTTEAFSCACEK